MIYLLKNLAGIRNWWQSMPPVREPEDWGLGAEGHLFFNLTLLYYVYAFPSLIT